MNKLKFFARAPVPAIATSGARGGWFKEVGSWMALVCGLAVLTGSARGQAAFYNDPNAFQSAVQTLGAQRTIDFNELDGGTTSNNSFEGRPVFDGNHYAARGITLSSPAGYPFYIAPGGYFWNSSVSLSVLRFPFDPSAGPAGDFNNDDSLNMLLSTPQKAVGFTLVDAGGLLAIEFLDAAGGVIHRLDNPPLPQFTSFRAFFGLVSTNRLIAKVRIVDAPGNNGDDFDCDDIVLVGNLPSSLGCATSLWSAEGNANDSLSGNNGTLLFGASYAPGKVGQAFHFTAAGQMVQVPSSPNLSFPATSPMSISLWAFRTGNSGLMHIVGKRNGCSGFNYQMALNMGSGEGLVFNAGGLGNGAATGQDLPMNTWTHLVGTFDGTTFRFYINGALMANVFGNPVGTLGPQNAAPFTIGNSGGCAGFVGLLDEVEIFGCALSLSEVQAIVAGGPPATTTPPPVVTGGLPGEGGIFGPGTAGFPHHVSGTVGGTGHPGCMIQLTISDPTHLQLANNNQTLTAIVDGSGNWAIPLTLDDCDPVIDIVQICDGVTSTPVHRHVFVDGTPPVFLSGGPGDGIHFSGGGGGGTVTILLEGGATDLYTFVPGGGVSYEWHLLGGGGAFTILGGGGSGGTLVNGGSGLSIGLPPGEYDFEIVVTDTAGNRLRKRCHHSIFPPLTITSGLPEEGGIYGPGESGSPGHVQRTVTGTGHAGCTVYLKITDTRLPDNPNNNRTLATTIDPAGHWSVDLNLDDCDPLVEIVEVCDGIPGDVIRRHIYVDGTPPYFLGGGPGDGVNYVGGGGTWEIVLDGGAGDRTLVPGGGVSYEWFLIGGDGSTRTPIGNGTGTLRLGKGPGEYIIEVVVTDKAGNKLKKRCVRRVLKRTVSVQIPDAVVYYNESVPLSGQVLDTIAQPSQAIVNAPLNFTVNGVPVANPAAYLATLKPAQYPIGATFPGNEQYESKSATATLTVLRRPTSVSTADVQVPFGSQVTLTGLLRDTRLPGALTGRPLTFTVNGQPVSNPFEALLSPGTYPVTAKYAGDDYYEPSTGKANLTILWTPGKITGGGSIDQKVRNFGFIVQTRTQAGVQSSTGSLEYQDKSLGYNLHATAITGIAIGPDRIHGIFTGPATLNGVAGYTFTAWIEDRAEPGAQIDKFRIVFSGGGVTYDSDTLATQGGILDQGGNIQIHKPQ